MYSGGSVTEESQYAMRLTLLERLYVRGESTSQVENAKLAVAHGNGGLLGGNHTGGTIILAAD